MFSDFKKVIAPAESGLSSASASATATVTAS